MEKDRKRVLKDYPHAYMSRENDGSYIVLDGEYAVAEEFYLPPALSEAEAWGHAALACKTTQNFNRSPPSRMDLSNVENKLNRINKRKRRGRRVR